MKSALFILLNFWVGFFSDIVLNFLSTKTGSKLFNSQIIKSLRPYFKKRGVIRAAIDAGITIVIVLLLVMGTSCLGMGFNTPNNIKQLTLFLLVAFTYGWVADILIDKFKIFGADLDDYYKVAGAGFWGSLALVFSIIISYIKERLILKYIYNGRKIKS